MLQTPPVRPARQVLATARAAWIPPFALMAGQLAHGLSWVLLGALAYQGAVGFTPAALAWVHVVALAWLTTVSLAVLNHVIPGVLDLDWRGEGMARGAIAPFWLGALAMALGFWRGDMGLVAGAATVVTVSLAVWLGCAAWTLSAFRRSSGASGAVMRAFITVFIALGITAVLGLGMAFALAGKAPGTWLVGLPALHAHLGGIGWLTLLVVGVAARTVRRITGAGPRDRRLHIAGATLLLFAVIAMAVAATTGATSWYWAAGALGLLGATSHALELAVAVRGAVSPHQPPRAFIGAAGLYLVLAAGLGMGVALGQTTWEVAYGFLALAGWLGQMVNGHLHHIGVRLLATLARGDEDETEPMDLLAPSLSWGAFAGFQIAVVAGTVALMAGLPWLLGCAAGAGLIGWVLMMLNVAGAWRNARA